MDKVSRTKSLVEEKFSLSSTLSRNDTKNLQVEMEILVNKIPSTERKKIAFECLGDIISILGKYLIRLHGYTPFSSILEKEIRGVGRRVARKLRKFVKIRKKTEKNAKKFINLAAILLGLKIRKLNNMVVAVNCPFYPALQRYDEPFMCNLCKEFNSGIVEEALGKNYEVERTKWMFEDGICVYKIKKK